jgi:hypothetical protein
VHPAHVRWMDQVRRRLGLLRDNVPYRTFVLARFSLMLAQLATPPDSLPWLSYLFTLVFVASGAHGTGSAIGNSGYLLDIAFPEQRSLYIEFTNTLFGIGILTSSLGGLIVDREGFGGLLSTLAGVFPGGGPVLAGDRAAALIVTIKA